MMIFMVVVVVLIFALHIITNLDGDEVDEDSYGGCGVELKKTYILSFSIWQVISKKNWTPYPNQTQTPRSLDTL